MYKQDSSFEKELGKTKHINSALFLSFLNDVLLSYLTWYLTIKKNVDVISINAH